MLYREGDSAGARALYTQVLAINRETGHQDWEAHNLSELGTLAKEEGELAAAGTLYREALAIRQAIGDKEGVAISLGNWRGLRPCGDRPSGGTAL